MKVYKGAIVCGYPGIGKSTLGAYRGAVDLESSFFYNSYKKNDTWAQDYCNCAMNLACQGHIVFVSTHDEVIAQLTPPYEGLPILYPVIFIPRPEWYSDWCKRLYSRYEKDKCNKNLRAAIHCIKNYDKDIQMLSDMGMINSPMVYMPETIDYDLRDFIDELRDIYEIKERTRE